MANQRFLSAVRLLLAAIADEAEARATCESMGGAVLFVALGNLSASVALRKEHAQVVRRWLGQEPAQDGAQASRELLIAVRLLLEALATEDQAREHAESLGGVALFLALGPLNEAVELRQGHVRLVNRWLHKAPGPAVTPMHISTSQEIAQ